MWPCLRLVVDGVATWTEVSSVMDLDDVLDLNDAVAFVAEVREPQK